MPIRKKPSGRWEVRVALGDGRRLERTLPLGASRQDALDVEAYLRRQQVDAAAGRPAPRPIDDALDHWEKAGAKALKSYEKDLRYRIAVLRQWTAGKSLDDLPAVAEKVKADGVASGMKAASVNRYLAILRRIGNLAERWGWTDKPLGRRVGLLPGEQARHVYLSPAQVESIAKACTDPVAGDAVRFAALTGLRRGEMLRLTPEMIVDGAVVLDAQTKSGRPRIVPLPPQARRIAKRRLPFRISAPLLHKVFNAARIAAGLPHVRFHDLRHANASWLVKAGAPMTAIRDLLGHSSLAVTSRYAHLRRDDLAAVTRKLRV